MGCIHNKSNSDDTIQNKTEKEILNELYKIQTKINKSDSSESETFSTYCIAFYPNDIDIDNNNYFLLFEEFKSYYESKNMKCIILICPTIMDNLFKIQKKTENMYNINVSSLSLLMNYNYLLMINKLKIICPNIIYISNNVIFDKIIIEKINEFNLCEIITCKNFRIDV